jgi:hypothetical protein
MAPGIRGFLVFFHESHGTLRHPENVCRIRISVFVGVLIPNVSITFVVSVSCRASAVDVPLAVMGRCVPGLAK